MDELLSHLLRVSIQNPGRRRLLEICRKFLNVERQPLDRILAALALEVGDNGEKLGCLFGLFCHGGHAAEVAALAKQATGVAKLAAEKALAGLSADKTAMSLYETNGAGAMFQRVEKPGPSEVPTAREIAIARLVCGRHSQIDVKTLIELLEYPDNLVDGLAKSALRQRGTSAADDLVSALPQLPLASKIMTIEILTEFGDGRVVEFVCDEIGRGTITDAGMIALRKLGMARGFQILLELAIQRTRVSQAQLAQVLQHLRKDEAEAFTSAFRSNLAFRRSGGWLVAKIAGEHALSTLIEALGDPRRAVRDSAEQGLAELGLVAAPELLARLAKRTAGADVRIRAMRLLARTHVRDAIPELAKIAVEGVGAERLTAVEALGTLWSGETSAIVYAAARSRDVRLRTAALRALGAAGGSAGSEAIEILVTAAEADAPAVSEAAFAGLQSIGMADPAASEAFVQPALRRLVAESTVSTRELAQQVLQRLEQQTRTLAVDPQTRRVGSAGAVGTRLNLADPLERWIQSATALHSPQWIAAPLPEPKQEVGSEVHFSVTAPERVAPARTFILDLWAHAERDYLRADRSSSLDIGNIRHIVRTVGPAVVNRGVRLAVDLSIPAFGFSASNWLYWGGVPSNCNFAIAVPSTLAFNTYAGTIAIKLETIRIASISFLIEVASEPTDRIEDVTGREHRRLRWFASYASDDRDDVLARIQGMLKIIPEMDVFVDVASLRSGDDWQARITDEIAGRDGLFLFWSPAAIRSKHVDSEWRTALAVKGIDGIDPVPLAPPSMAPPPPELSSLHFNEWTLAFQSNAEGRNR